MLTITIYQNEDGVVGFHSNGHAGFANYGKDIVCAGASALVLNAINSIERFTSAKFHLETDQKQGLIDFRLEGQASSDVKLLLDSLVLGLQGIQNDYGNKYIILKFKEV